MDQTIKEDSGKIFTKSIENKNFEKNHFLDNKNKIRKPILEKEARFFINKIF